MPGSVRTKKKFRQPENFSKIKDFTFLSKTCDPESGFNAVFAKCAIHRNTDGPLSENTSATKQINFNIFTLILTFSLSQR